MDNYVCDAACNIAECGYDKGMCGGDHGSYGGTDGGDHGSYGSTDGDDSYPHCDRSTCHMGWIGDGVCDASCNNMDCGYDEGDCQSGGSYGGTDGGDHGSYGGTDGGNYYPHCPSECAQENIGNGMCDDACVKPECGYDHGDCCASSSSSECTPELMDNYVCDAACNIAECGYDKGMCGGDHGSYGGTDGGDHGSYGSTDGDDSYPHCDRSTCHMGWIGDGVCDASCNNMECGYDEGDCQSGGSYGDSYASSGSYGGSYSDAYPHCDRRYCPVSIFNDGTCHAQCNNHECGYDGNDCMGIANCPSTCMPGTIGDSVCNPACLEPGCIFDAGDCCMESSQCTLEMLMNDVCDTACKNENCLYDYGYCDKPGEGESDDDNSNVDDFCESSSKSYIVHACNKGEDWHALYDRVNDNSTIMNDLDLGLPINGPVAGFGIQLNYPTSPVEVLDNSVLVANGAIKLGIVAKSKVDFMRGNGYTVKLSFRRVDTKQKIKKFLPIRSWLGNEAPLSDLQDGRATLFNADKASQLDPRHHYMDFDGSTVNVNFGIDIVVGISDVPDGEYILKIKVIKKKESHEYCPPDKPHCYGSWKGVNFFALPVKIDSTYGTCNYNYVSICDNATNLFTGMGKWVKISPENLHNPNQVH